MVLECCVDSVMPRFLPLFPLEIVAFPGENLNLHIFEPRYRELINECVASKKTFGIPVYLGNQVSDFGTEMEVVSVEKIYPGGEMDIRTRGLQVVRVLEFLTDVPEKLYSAGIVQEWENQMDSDAKVASALFGYLRQLQSLLNIRKPELSQPSEIHAFDVAHYVGLDLKDKYEMLRYNKETDRQKLLVDHLKRIIPQLSEQTEKAKSIRLRASLNGQFRKEIPPSLE